MIDTQKIVDFLNEIVKLDPVFMKELINKRAKSNDKLNDYQYLLANLNNEVGILGLLNGLIKRYGSTDVICSFADADTGELLMFDIFNELKVVREV